MDVDSDEASCGGYVYVSCGWDTHSHPAHLRGQRVTIVVTHQPVPENGGEGEGMRVEEKVMVEAPTPAIES